MRIFKFLLPFARLSYSISIACLCLYTTLAFINVIARYFFLKPYPWTEEITTLLFVLGVFLNQVILEIFDRQLSVSFIMSRIKNETALKIIYILKRVLVIGMWLLLIKEAVPVIQRNYLFETASVILRIPMWPLYTIVTVVMASVVLINLEKILVQLLPPKDHAGYISV